MPQGLPAFQIRRRPDMPPVHALEPTPPGELGKHKK